MLIGCPLQIWYDTFAAQYQVAEDHLFRELTGMAALAWPEHGYQMACMQWHIGIAGVVETAIANPNTSLAVLGGLSLVVLPGKHHTTAQSTPQSLSATMRQPECICICWKLCTANASSVVCPAGPRRFIFRQTVGRLRSEGVSQNLQPATPHARVYHVNTVTLWCCSQCTLLLKGEVSA